MDDPENLTRIVPSRIPLLRHTYVIVTDDEEAMTEEMRTAILGFAWQFGEDKSREVCGHPGAFTIIASGKSARRVSGFHVHVAVVNSRWKKWWLYFVLSTKNLLQAIGLRRDSRG